MIVITENEKKFKPCPHCGETDIHWDTSKFPNGERIRRYCRYCGMSTGWHETDVDAREQWNTRFEIEEESDDE